MRYEDIHLTDKNLRELFSYLISILNQKSNSIFLLTNSNVQSIINDLVKGEEKNLNIVSNLLKREFNFELD